MGGAGYAGDGMKKFFGREGVGGNVCWRSCGRCGRMEGWVFDALRRLYRLLRRSRWMLIIKITSPNVGGLLRRGL